MLSTMYVHSQFSEQRLSFPVYLRCRSRSNPNVQYVFIVCPLSIQTVFSVLVHPALVQIHFSWSVSLSLPGQFSVGFSSLKAWTKDALPWFHPWSDALQER